MRHKKPKIEPLIFLVILAIAVFFRFYQLDSIPPGLWPDEAANGVDALKALDECQSIEVFKCLKGFKIFYPANNGREGLFINLQAVSIAIFGPQPWSLRVVSAIMGTLTVAGLYFLARRLFNWQVASISSFLLAVSFWHVIFSRIGFRAIMLPLVLVWGFYFLWRGLRNGSLGEFFIAGLIGGLGFYTYFSYRITPLIVAILIWNYWSYLKKDFAHSKYQYVKSQLARGFVLFVVTAAIVALPLGIYFYYLHPEDFLKREGNPISVFDQNEPLKELGMSVVKTLAMFNVTGDYNQRHNIPGSPQLVLPIGVLFVVGFLREFIHWIKRKHGHFSTVHTLLFSWFFIMLIPGFLSTEAPHALRAIGVTPVVMIFAAQGFLWLINIILRIHRLNDPHFHYSPIKYHKEVSWLVVLTVIGFLTSIGFWEYSRYFRWWGHDPMIKQAFAQKYVSIAEYLNSADSNLPKYVLINEGDVLIDDVPNNAQTIKFLTQTHTQYCSNQRKIEYIRDDQLKSLSFPRRYILIPMADSPALDSYLKKNLGLSMRQNNNISIYEK